MKIFEAKTRLYIFPSEGRNQEKKRKFQMSDNNNRFYKDPREQFPVGIDHVSSYPVGASSITSIEVSALDYDLPDEDLTSDLIQDPSFADTIVQTIVKGGDHDKKYKIEFITTFDDESVLVDTLVMECRRA